MFELITLHAQHATLWRYGLKYKKNSNKEKRPLACRRVYVWWNWQPNPYFLTTQLATDDKVSSLRK